MASLRICSTTRRQRGAILPLLAGGAAALIAATAFAIDLGRLMVRNRDMQAIADIAAIEGARLLDGRTVGEVRPSVLVAVHIAAARNGEEGASFEVEFGTYDEYRRDFIVATSDADVPNALLVHPTDDVDFVFAPGSRTAGRTAVALQPAVTPNPPPPPPPPLPPPPPPPAPPPTTPPPVYVPQPPTGGFTIGSYLLGLDSTDSTILNALLGALPGSPSFSFNTVSWQGIGAARVNADDLAAELGFASPSEMADADVDVKDLIEAMAVVGQGDAAALAHVNNIGASITGGTTIGMGDLMEVTTGGNSAAAISDVSIAGLLTGSAILADGDHAITVPGLFFGIPGVTATQLSLTFIEKPQTAFGEEGVSASTRQATVTITNTVNIPLTPPVDVSAVSLQGQVVIAVNNDPAPSGVAGATATLSNIACSGTEGIILDVATRAISSGASVTGQLVADLPVLPDITEPVGLSGNAVSTPTVGQVDFEYPGQFYIDPTFFGPKSFGSQQVGLSGVDLAYSDGIANATLAPLTNTVTDAVLEPLLTQIDSTIIASLSSLLGLGFGGAHLWANGMTCLEPVLVPVSP